MNDPKSQFNYQKEYQELEGNFFAPDSLPLTPREDENEDEEIFEDCEFGGLEDQITD